LPLPQFAAVAGATVERLVAARAAPVGTSLLRAGTARARVARRTRRPRRRRRRVGARTRRPRRGARDCPRRRLAGRQGLARRQRTAAGYLELAPGPAPATAAAAPCTAARR